MSDKNLPDRKQPHGGSLLTGNPNNTGGGRPPNEVRNKARDIFDAALETLRQFAANEPRRLIVITKTVEVECEECEHRFEVDVDFTDVPRYLEPKDVLKAIDIAGKYGMGGNQVDFKFVEALAKRFAVGVQFHVSKLIGGQEAMDAIEQAWNNVLDDYRDK